MLIEGHFHLVLEPLHGANLNAVCAAEMTVKNDGNFWSSTGSPHDIGEEFILYKLKHPLSVVRAVVVQVYRATFQGGCDSANHQACGIKHEPTQY
jgi:hypothetical protein